ncbi:Bicarbonate transport ATP-binding protein CmpD [Mycolicibacterium vanbaalenii]|uniref:Bicarbonate transport ATP-binding protein CmpD n=1 Tax=Mycolicibacterium vanbaalenii TaxID=110539 RepID=A0A5S9R6T9_MYCVN|nr:ABC transporter ATP-binding protein [Mycolicibacterium vanbaalenii]CAA0132977.1 Bicarbonate transport ATP-binding protein CmpD [Mycolicibacterium vanbaalenii]
MTDFLTITDLSYAYPGNAVPALSDVSLRVAHGEFACIVGPSGCGKSTLLNILSGLATPTVGTVTVDGIPLVVDGVDQRVPRPRLGYLFQDPRLLPWRSVRKNIELALKAADVPRIEWRERADRYLDLCEIGQFAESWPGSLSGGQRQRVAIARALAIEPACVLLDEPFSALDEVTGRSLRGKLLELWAKAGQTFIFITHSIREAVFLADHVYVMAPGPGRVLERVTIDIPRPRRYESAAIAQVEGHMIDSVLQYWTTDDNAGSAA